MPCKVSFCGPRFGSKHTDKLNTPFDRKIKEFFREVVLDVIQQKKDVEFYCGMDRGYELLMAELVLDLRTDYRYKVFATLPYVAQHTIWPSVIQEKYIQLLRACDGQIMIDEMPQYKVTETVGGYASKKLENKFHYLAENMDYMIMLKTKVSDLLTEEYFRAKGVEVISYHVREVR